MEPPYARQDRSSQPCCYCSWGSRVRHGDVVLANLLTPKSFVRSFGLHDALEGDPFPPDHIAKLVSNSNCTLVTNRNANQNEPWLGHQAPERTWRRRVGVRLLSSSDDRVDLPYLGFSFLLAYEHDEGRLDQAARDSAGGCRYSVGDRDHEKRLRVEVRFRPQDITLRIPPTQLAAVDNIATFDYGTVNLPIEFHLRPVTLTLNLYFQHHGHLSACSSVVVCNRGVQNGVIQRPFSILTRDDQYRQKKVFTSGVGEPFPRHSNMLQASLLASGYAAEFLPPRHQASRKSLGCTPTRIPSRCRSCSAMLPSGTASTSSRRRRLRL